MSRHVAGRKSPTPKNCRSTCAKSRSPKGIRESANRNSQLHYREMPPFVKCQPRPRRVASRTRVQTCRCVLASHTFRHRPVLSTGTITDSMEGVILIMPLSVSVCLRLSAGFCMRLSASVWQSPSVCRTLV